jgi:aminotransferase
MINTPANPSGKVWSPQELELVADFARRRDLFVFTDEIYEHFLYDGRQHAAPAAIGDLRDRTITMSGLSKTFSITGWRIGYAACAARFAEMIGYINDLVYVCAPAPLQMGVARGLDTLPGDFYTELCNAYSRKRDRTCQALSAAGLEPYVPEGAYYVLANATGLPGRTSKDRAMHLLERVGVAAVPGSAFFHAGDGESLLRFCFAKTDRDLDEALRRLNSIKG